MVLSIIIFMLIYIGAGMLMYDKFSAQPVLNSVKPQVKIKKEFSKIICNAIISDRALKSLNFIDFAKSPESPYQIDEMLDNIKVDGKQYHTALVKHQSVKKEQITANEFKDYSLLVVFNSKETFVQMINTQPKRWNNYLTGARRNKEEFAGILDNSFYPVRASKMVQERNVAQYIYN